MIDSDGNTSSFTGVALMALVLLLLLTTEAGLLNAYGQQNCLSYSSDENIISVTCDTQFQQIPEQVDPNILQQETDGQYILRATIRVSAQATLTIAGPGVSWVKITGDNGIISRAGVLEIEGVRITSWNETANDVVYQDEDGSVRRGWGISVIDSSSSYIKHSEISHLGYDGILKRGIDVYRSKNFTIIGSKIHHMWMGFYSTNVSNIVIHNNTFYNNIKYAIDPHTGTHDMLVSNNHVYNNSGIAVICSLDCYNIGFEYNEVHDNEGAGLFFSRNTHDSVMRFNKVYNHNTTCIAVHSSSNNLIHDNELSNCYNGIYVKNAHGVLLENNKIDNTEYSVRMVAAQVSSDGDIIRNSLKSHQYLLSSNSVLNISNHSFHYKSIRGVQGVNIVTVSDSGMARVTLKTSENVTDASGNEISITSRYRTLYDTDASPYSEALGYETIVINNDFPPNYFNR